MLPKSNKAVQSAVWQRPFYKGVPLSADLFKNVGDQAIILEEYADLGAQMYGYLFLICEQRKFPTAVKY